MEKKLFKCSKNENYKENNVLVFKLKGNKLIKHNKDFLKKKWIKKITIIKVEQTKKQGNKNNNEVLLYSFKDYIWTKKDLIFNKLRLMKFPLT